MEKKYRGSVMCRVLSYPITYAILKMLLKNGPMKLNEIVTQVQRTKSTVCGHLANLKLANLVRYDKERKETLYWIKYPKEVEGFLRACEKLVERTTRRIKKDF